jgi:hypothetical protein
MKTYIVLIVAGDIDCIDDALGDSVDADVIEEYATLCINDEARTFEDGQVSNPEYLNILAQSIAAACKGKI